MVARAAAESWSQPVSTPLFSAGTMHIAEQPEFALGSRLGSLLRVVESGTPLDRLMVHSVEGQVAVRVGLDEDRALSGLSLVSYLLPGPVRAAVGVLGPLRMDYALALPVVDAVGRALPATLDMTWRRGARRRKPGPRSGAGLASAGGVAEHAGGGRGAGKPAAAAKPRGPRRAPAAGRKAPGSPGRTWGRPGAFQARRGRNRPGAASRPRVPRRPRP
jgi:hypothetical protein